MKGKSLLTNRAAMLALLEKAMVKSVAEHHDRIMEAMIMGVDVGAPGGDYTGFAFRGTNSNAKSFRYVETIIVDDPYAEEQRTFEGEFHEVKPREAMSSVLKYIEHEKLPAARSTEKNRGPQPRTKYPRRR